MVFIFGADHETRGDTYGIPHILEEGEEAAAFGFGYAQAEDHCLAIARALVVARGEEAKYFGTPVRAFSALAHGQSSDPDSPHSSDQIRLFAGHQLHPIWFSESDIKAHLEREYNP